MIVDLNLSEEQRMIDESLSSLLQQRLPVSRLRDPGAHGAAAERYAWASFVELGLFGLGIAEADGGLGLGTAEEVLTAQALGRHLASPSLLAQIAATHLAPDPQFRSDLLGGKTRAAFANSIGGGEAQTIDADEAEHLVVIGAEGARLERNAGGEPGGSLDETLVITHAVIGNQEAPRTSTDDRISLLIAAYLTGIAQAAQAMAVDHAKTREQFGQPIGAFQAIKHQCADMAVRSAAAEAQVYYAATIFAASPGDPAEVAAARLLATRAALENAKTNIQVHGGMGFTAECDAHLFLKRAHMVAALGSSRAAEQARLLAG
jgi:alkylation response protein AidB-like acyl-CoA dehydrogenase